MPPLLFSAYQYRADDGDIYQIGVFDDIATWGCGDLLPASGGELPFPALATARHMVAKGTGFSGMVVVRVPCNANHPSYIQGPGATIIYRGIECKVVASIGEKHLDGSR